MENEIETSEVSTSGLTSMQAAFVDLVANGAVNQVEAARIAGYQHPEKVGSRVAALPHVRAAILAKRQSILETDLASLGLRTIRKLMEDEMTPAPVRFQAAKWSLETAGHTTAIKAATSSAEKQLHEMSVEELEAFIRRGENALSGLKRVNPPTIELPANTE